MASVFPASHERGGQLGFGFRPQSGSCDTEVRLPFPTAVLAHKEEWTRLTSAERKKRPEIANLLKQSTDLILKIVALDRENEQLMLRLKLVPPSHMPPAERQNPSLVAKLYKDQP